MFTRTAAYYDALYEFKDYSAACGKLNRVIQHHCPGAGSLLDVGCGTGKHLEYLKSYYEVTGLDVDPNMTAVANQRNPDVLFHIGDMTDFNLHRKFDIVTCLFSSIGYVKTLSRMNRAVANMAHHLNPKGLIVIEPWFTPEHYWTDRLTANYVDEPELKIAWMYISRRKGRLSILDVNYLVGSPEGIQHFTERHELGLYTHQEYLQALEAVDLSVVFDEQGLFNRGLYVGKP